MKAQTRAAARLSILAASVAGLAALSTPAMAQEMPRGWFKNCQEQGGNEVCQVQNIMLSESGQLLTGVSLIEIEGDNARRVLQVIVPPARLIPPGIGMQVDSGQAQKLDYVLCFPDRCIAEVALTNEIVNSFKRGSQITMTSVNYQNQQNPVQVTLQGFTQSYDGAPLQQSDLQERQRQLQDYVSRNTQDFDRRLREEQERAVQAD